MNVSFKGSLISQTTVNKKNFFNKKYSQKQVSFVELDHWDCKDLQALNKLSKSWPRTLAKTIEYFAIHHVIHMKTFALTQQNKDFENINPKKILGIVQAEPISKYHYHIEHFQVNPKYISTESKNPKFKKVGTTIINCIKSFKDLKMITLDSIPNAKDFYIKNHFKNHDPFHPYSLYWEKPDEECVYK